MNDQYDPDAQARDRDLFELRAHAHDWNINTLDGVLASIIDRASRISLLQHKLAQERSEIDDLVDELANQLTFIDGVARRQRAESLPRIVEYIRLASQQLAALRAQINNARETVQQIAPLKIDSDSLRKRNSEFTSNLDEPRAKLATMRRTPHAPDSWRQLKDFKTKWVGYLDYVAGLCLRHDGLDGGICAIADALIAELVSASTDLEALAIPGRGPRDRSMPKIVYLSFPEWTVWALPLAAHELWHIARHHAQLGRGFSIVAMQKLSKLLAYDDIVAGEEDELLDECIADAFATYTMGPSYAYAALVLVLDPGLHDDRLRAATILRTLERIASRDQASADTTHVDLARLWDGALVQANETKADVTPTFAAWLDVFLEYLDNIDAGNRTLQFDTTKWASVREDLKYKVVTQDGACDSGMGLRFVLSAAWEARVEQPERFGAIAERCAELCRQIKSLPSPRARKPTAIAERPDLSN